jgi:hypothetical protein
MKPKKMMQSIVVDAVEVVTGVVDVVDAVVDVIDEVDEVVDESRDRLSQRPRDQLKKPMESLY